MNFLIFNFLNGIAVKYPDLDRLFVFMANNLGYIAVAALVYYLFSHDERKKGMQEVAMIVAIAGLAWVAAHFLKDVFHTARPFIALSDVKNLFPGESGYAFPSGHATFYSALAMMMYFYHKRIGLGLGLIALIIGISRIISGVHWPIDILGGFILGPVIAILAYFFIKKYLFANLPQNR
ncbi:MAG: phosphatase PAP2 family protein [Candidatus Paceibacterota bacterium]|jgi:undecaprenyl-diphosphatase